MYEISFLVTAILIWTIDYRLPQVKMMMQPYLMFFTFVFIGFIIYLNIDYIKEHCGTKAYLSEMLGIVIILILTFGLISFSAAFAPLFFEKMNYKVTSGVNNTSSGTISASDATSIFSSSIFTAVIAYIFWELEKIKTESRRMKNKEKGLLLLEFNLFFLRLRNNKIQIIISLLKL